jgi:shikimate kinase
VHLILMGLRGSGKSTLGRGLASRSGLAFVDLDDRTAASLGARTVAEAWASRGQSAFREAEAVALRSAIEESVPILALGGGTPTAPGASDLLRSLKRADPPRIIYLRATADELAARLRATDLSARPSLTGRDPVAEIAEVLSARGPLYESLADLVLDVGTMSRGGAMHALAGILQRR